MSNFGLRAGEGVHYSHFTWVPELRMFVGEISSLTGLFRHGNPFICDVATGRPAVRVIGRKSTLDFIWSHNIQDVDGDTTVAVYTNGKLSLYLINT